MNWNFQSQKHYKGRTVKYSPIEKNSKVLMTQQVIVNKLKKTGPIKQISEDKGVTGDTDDRIKKEIDSLD